MKITIKILEKGEEILSKVFDEGVYRAGRSDFSDIVLPSDSISRSHLELRITESAVYLTNMSNAGKVKLNGKATETAEIADGDEVTVGPYRIIIFHGERDVVAKLPESTGLEPASEAPPASASDENAFEPNQFGDPPPESPPEPPPAAEPQYGEEAAPQGATVADFDAPHRSPSQSAERVLPFDGTSALNRAETQVEIKPVVAKIIFTEGPRTGEEMRLEAFEVTLGRSRKADIFIDDEKLSRLHAKIARVGLGYRLIDLNSRHGTYVNGMRVLEHPLSSFDEIQIGNAKMKFLIHDVIVSEMQRAGGQLATIADRAPAVEQTRSIKLNPAEEAALQDLQSIGPNAPELSGGIGLPGDPSFDQQQLKSRRTKMILGAVILLGLLYLVLPSHDKAKNDVAKKPVAAESKAPPEMPKEYSELTEESQRAVEGYYNAALKLGEREQYEEALVDLKKIHEVLPYYKKSREMQDQFSKRFKEKQIAEASEKAKHDDKQDLNLYLQEGQEYLKEGDFDRAAEAFNSAIAIDPNSQIAIRGLKAAEYKVKNFDEIPPEKDPESDKRKVVAELFQKAVAAFTNKSYQEAIDTSEKIRQVELRGDTQYLNEAKQIIDRARMLQKEEFEPFLIQAKEKYAEGDYNASRDLCDEMLKRDGAYEEAKECVLKAKKQLNRLAKEAYTHGYILESMNRIEEAKQYWNRAKNYTRAGDDYYDKVNRKLENYQ